MSRQIRFNAFDMNCVAHQSPGLWRHPKDQSHRYKELSYWTDLAKLLERGTFDGIFIADVLGIYDAYNGNGDAAIRHAAQVPVSDPILLASAIAGATEHLGIGITAGTGFEHPFPFARRLTTLDHLTNGRIGWNVVTGYLPSAAKNMGQLDQLQHDERYDHADEYLEVLYKLWEGSWEDDAVIRDRETGVFTDPSKVHPINHHGKYFDVPGIHVGEPSPQRSPVIYQAGASPRGLAFATGNAEAIFVAAPTKAILKKVVRTIREGLVANGRDPYSAKVYTLLTIVTDETEAKAQAKLEEYHRYASIEGSLVFMSGWMGVDLGAYDPSDPVGDVQSNAIISAVSNFQQADPSGKDWTVEDIGKWGRIGGMGPVLVGSAERVADELQEWVEETDVDGFNLAYAITPGTFEDIVEFIVPELRRRGVYPDAYVPGTLRHKLFGQGDRLAADHPAQRFRYAGAQDYAGASSLA